MQERVGFRCSAASTVSDADRDTICAEFLAAMAAMRPDLEFGPGDTPSSSAEILVTHAGPRSVGLDVTWVTAGGQRLPGTPLQRTFFDRGADPELRARFYATFLNTNPIPF